MKQNVYRIISDKIMKRNKINKVRKTIKHYSAQRSSACVGHLSQCLLSVFCALLFTTSSVAQTFDLPRTTPERMGIDSKVVSVLFDSILAMPKNDIHSVMILRHDSVLAEIYPKPFEAKYKHTMYSCSKTFVAAAVGIAISENRLRLTDRVATFFPDELPDTLSDNLASMTIRDLLTMSSGIEPDWVLRNHGTDWTKRLLTKPVAEPGKKFKYDSLCTYLLSAIVQKVTGQLLLDYLQDRIFNALNIHDVAWEQSPEGVNTGGWGLYIQSESLAKFGLLLLHRGKWHDRQLIPAAWVDEMMKVQIETGYDSYGYQMWQCNYPGVFRADGALGQYVMIVPKEDMVIVITECNSGDGAHLRDLFWRDLMPAIKSQPLRESRRTKRLQKRRDQLRTPMGKRSSENIKTIANQRYALPDNPYGWKQLSVKREGNRLVLNLLCDSGRELRLPLGYRSWLSTTTDEKPFYTVWAVDRFKGIDGPFHIAGSYAWTSGSKLAVRLQYTNWVSALDLKFDFTTQMLSVRENNSDQGKDLKMTLLPQ